MNYAYRKGTKLGESSKKKFEGFKKPYFAIVTMAILPLPPLTRIFYILMLAHCVNCTKWVKAFKKLQVCQKAKAIHRFGLSHSWDLQMMNKYNLVSEKQKDMIEYYFAKFIYLLKLGFTICNTSKKFMRTLFS